jgi:hypothetical protein
VFLLVVAEAAATTMEWDFVLLHRPALMVFALVSLCDGWEFVRELVEGGCFGTWRAACGWRIRSSSSAVRAEAVDLGSVGLGVVPG